ncbi:MAG: PQQ-binding-like beta-propeller repeat protein [Phycisphaerales bacterium]
MQKFAIALVAIALITTTTSRADEAAQHWPQWRGPDANGFSGATGLPLTWSAEENIVWKTPVPAWSGATPIIWGDRIYIMSPSAAPEAPAEEVRDEEEAAEQDQPQRGRRGRRGGGRSPGGEDILIFCISKTNGEILWQHAIDQGNRLWMKGNNASPSPVTDGEHVWAVTGNGTVIAFAMDGAVRWQRNLQSDYGEFGLNWGYASSPLLHDGKLIIEVLHGMRTDDPSYIVAFDALSGEETWKVERPTDAPAESPDAYTTPVVFETDGEEQIVITGGDYITGHDPKTGEELWRVPGLNPRKARNYRIVASPVAIDGMIYAPTRVRPLLAIRPGSEGASSDDIIWQWDAAGSPDVPTPACDGERFYMLNDAGMITCLNAKTGEVIWGPERTVQGTVSSSPIVADGRVYFTNEEGVTVVVNAGDEFKILATNTLDGSYTLSSPAISGSQLFIRTGTHLYCIGEKSE